MCVELKKRRTWAPRVPVRMDPPALRSQDLPDSMKSRSETRDATRSRKRRSRLRALMQRLHETSSRSFDFEFDHEFRSRIPRGVCEATAINLAGTRVEGLKKKEERRKQCPPIGAPFLSIQSSRPSELYRFLFTAIRK